MIDTKALLNTISSVYAVPGDESGWVSVLGDTTHLVRGTAGVYLMIDNVESNITQVSAMFGYPRDEIRELYEGNGAAHKDVRYQYLDNLIPGRVFREFEYVPDKEAYDSCEWIQHELRTRGIYWNMAARISTHGLWLDIVSFNRVKTAGPYSDEEKAALQALLPHMSRAAELHRTVTRLQDIYGAVLSVLDRLLVGLVILDTQGRVVLTNAAASRAADDSAALRVSSNGRIHATDTQTDVELQKLIAGTVRTANVAGTSDGGQIVVPARKAGEKLLIELMPIRDDGLPDGEGIRGVAIFIIDPNRSHILNTEGLARIFSLSPSESAITKALVNGARPKQIAEERRTSFETVRSQIKSIYNKTGAASQTDLLRLSAKADPPIERNQNGTKNGQDFCPSRRVS